MRPWNVNDPAAGRSREARLKSLARKVRDWLDGYLQEAREESPGEHHRNPETPASSESRNIPGEDMISRAAQEPPGAAWWERRARSHPPEHWLGLVREGAPGLLGSIKEESPAQAESFPIGTTSQEIEPEGNPSSVPSMVNGKAGGEARLAPREISPKQTPERDAQSARGRSWFQRFVRLVLTNASPQTRRKEEREVFEAGPANQAEKEFGQTRLASDSALRTEAVAKDQALANPSWTKSLKQKLGRVAHSYPGPKPLGPSGASRSTTVPTKSMDEREAGTKTQEAFGSDHPGFNIPEPRPEDPVRETLAQTSADGAGGRTSAAVVRVNGSAIRVPGSSETLANDRHAAALDEGRRAWQVNQTLAQRHAVDAESQASPLDSPAVSGGIENSLASNKSRLFSPDKAKPTVSRQVTEPDFPNDSRRDLRQPRREAEGRWSGEPLSAEGRSADPWPELPQSQPFAQEAWMPSLRDAERLRALDAEQRGAR